MANSKENGYLFFDKKIGVYDEANAFIQPPGRPPAPKEERRPTDHFEPILDQDKEK